MELNCVVSRLAGGEEADEGGHREEEDGGGREDEDPECVQLGRRRDVQSLQPQNFYTQGKDHLRSCTPLRLDHIPVCFLGELSFDSVTH